jgi:hypothetical protein
VSANTHKGLALEILMTMAHILDEGVPSLSFHLEGVGKEILSGTPSSKCFTHGCAKGFWGE